MAQISIAEIQTNFMPNANHLCETWSYECQSKNERLFFRKSKTKYFRGDIFLDVEICRR